jgi:MFS transporter, putative metabolite:H+ symporter
VTLKKWDFLSPAVIVVALGYFVDIFDLTLFGMVRVPSLIDLGLSGDELTSVGILLLNTQMAGMLAGGLLWGILGDKKGRLQVLFGSIILYSLANLLNGFVQTIPQYIILRFLSGLGLAGELGAGITLVCESLPTSRRGLGTALVATIGVLGATLAGIIVETCHWRTAYFVGGSLGLALLFLRIKVSESTLFDQSKKEAHIRWGDIRQLFNKRGRFLACILLGVPIWYVAGIVMSFSPELARSLAIGEEVTAARAISISYLGLAFGDLFSGLLSQFLRSRKAALFIFYVLTIISLAVLFATTTGQGAMYYYSVCFAIGIGAGFWAIFVTVAAEQFGTNLRATVATSVPNFVRASVIPMTLSLKSLMPLIGTLYAMIAIGVIVFIIGLLALASLKETFHTDLHYFEE